MISPVTKATGRLFQDMKETLSAGPYQQLLAVPAVLPLGGCWDTEKSLFLQLYSNIIVYFVKALPNRKILTFI